MKGSIIQILMIDNRIDELELDKSFQVNNIPYYRSPQLYNRLYNNFYIRFYFEPWEKINTDDEYIKIDNSNKFFTIEKNKYNIVDKILDSFFNSVYYVFKTFLLKCGVVIA